MSHLPILSRKLELHAHLNGCVRLSHLRDILSSQPSTFPLPSPPPPDASPKDYFEFMGAVGVITSKPENLRKAVGKVLEDFEADGVVYLELRSTPKENEFMTKKDYIEIIIDCMRSYQGEMIARYLVSVDQSRPLEDMLENADFAIQYTKTSPYVVGVDLCGNFYKTSKSNTLQVLSKCKEAGLKIACHIAEDAAVANHTADILRLIQPDRLGHATFISPSSEDGVFIRENNILIECCMTSNLLCKSVPCYSKHHFNTWRDLGHPVLLCTDDPGTFDTSLTKEYDIAMSSFGLRRGELRESGR